MTIQPSHSSTWFPEDLHYCPDTDRTIKFLQDLPCLLGLHTLLVQGFIIEPHPHLPSIPVGLFLVPSLFNIYYFFPLLVHHWAGKFGPLPLSSPFHGYTFPLFPILPSSCDDVATLFRPLNTDSAEQPSDWYFSFSHVAQRNSYSYT